MLTHFRPYLSHRPHSGVASALRDGRVSDALRHAVAHQHFVAVHTPLVLREAPLQPQNHQLIAAISVCAAAIGAYLIRLT